jgi:hypothetical protein
VNKLETRGVVSALIGGDSNDGDDGGGNSDAD